MMRGRCDPAPVPDAPMNAPRFSVVGDQIVEQGQIVGVLDADSVCVTGDLAVRIVALCEPSCAR